MEISATRSKNKFLKFLPRAASAITFHGPPFSPKDNKRPDNNGLKPKSHLGTKGGFSGPIISLIPAEARRRKQPKNSSFEPTSPKVSCMGQIKHKKKHKNIIKKEKHNSLPRDFKPVNSVPDHQRDQEKEKKKKKRQPSVLGKLFCGARARPPHGRRPEENKPKVNDRAAAPGLAQIRRFASGRDHSLANFDWTAQIAPVDLDDDGDYYSDEEERGGGGGEREVIIPFSAPILMGGGGGGVVALEPKKEINLWKRRTMAQPRPLQVN